MSGGYFVERVCLVLVIIPPLLAGSAASSRLCFSPPIRSPKTALQPRESLCQLGGRVPLAAAHHGLRPGGLSLSAKRSKNRKPVGTKREQGGSGKGFGSSKVGATLSEDLESDVDLELSGINLEEQLLDLGPEGWISADQVIESFGSEALMRSSPGALVDFLDDMGSDEEDDLIQVAEEEALLQRDAPRAPARPPCADPAVLVAAVGEEGLGRMPGALSAGEARALRGAVLAQRDASEAAGEGERARLFTEVLAPLDERGLAVCRWDVRMPLAAPATRAALAALLRPGAPLGDALERLCGADAEVVELAAFVNAPGARRQALHADTLFTPDPALYTVFVALQDTGEALGPTVLLPRSHRAEAHAAFDDPRARRAFLRGAAYTVADLAVGEVLLYDSRALHCGGANEGAEERVVFYLSLAASNGSKGKTPGGNGSKGDVHNVRSIHQELRGAHTLASLRAAVLPVPDAR